MDVRSRRNRVVAQVDDPYGRKDERPPLKVGQFVKAHIQGRLLKDQVVIPQAALREGRFVLLIDEDNRLLRQQIQIHWLDEEDVVIASGIEPGQVVCLTPVTYAANGARVIPTIDGELRLMPDQKPKGPPPGAGKAKTKEPYMHGQDQPASSKSKESGTPSDRKGKRAE